MPIVFERTDFLLSPLEFEFNVGPSYYKQFIKLYGNCFFYNTFLSELYFIDLLHISKYGYNKKMADFGISI